MAAACALLLAGCASLQDPAASPTSVFTPPAAWSGALVAGEDASTPASLAAWWQHFGDPALAPLVERALSDNTGIQAAQARLRQARAQRDLAAASLSPTVGSSASAQANRSDGRSGSEQFRAGLDASWEPDLWGATDAGVRAADAGGRASAATLAGTRVAVAAEVALNLLQWRGTQRRLQIARDSLASQQQTLQITQWREQAGLVTRLDVEQARTAVEQTRSQIPALQATAGQTLNALAVLTGQAPGALQTTLGVEGQPATQSTPPPALTLALPAEVLRQRPDVIAAEQQLVAAAARVDQADAQRLPSFSLGGSIGLSALSLAALGSGAGVASLAASVSLPVFDGGRLRAQVRAQEAARDEAAANYRATLLGALQEVEDALVALQGTRQQQASQQAAAGSARLAATLAEQRYASGLVDFQNVLQTQRTLLAAEDSLASTATTLNTQHVRLYKALGGGWVPSSEESPR